MHEYKVPELPFPTFTGIGNIMYSKIPINWYTFNANKKEESVGSEKILNLFDVIVYDVMKRSEVHRETLTGYSRENAIRDVVAGRSSLFAHSKKPKDFDFIARSLGTVRKPGDLD